MCETDSEFAIWSRAQLKKKKKKRGKMKSKRYLSQMMN